MNRRDFIQTVAGISLASFTLTKVSAQTSSAKLKIVVFWEEGFPTVDGLNLTKPFLQNAFAPHEVIFADSEQLNVKLAEEIDVFVNPYGSAFPKKNWSAILAYLQKGGNFLNLGGKPFSVPVTFKNGAWKAENPQVNFHKRLGILQYSAVTPSANSSVETNLESLKKLPLDLAENFYATYPRMTTGVEFPEESGSDGQREAKLEVLAFRINNLNERDVAPVVCFDRLRGEFAGGRWVFVAMSLYETQVDKFDAKILKDLAETASFGAFYFEISPTFASYRENETPKLKVKSIRPQKEKNQLKISLDLLNIEIPDSSVAIASVFLSGSSPTIDNLLELKQILRKNIGFYPVEISYLIEAKIGLKVELKNETGFWFYNEKSLESNNTFTADKHFLYRNGIPFPVVGTTYMASDVHRRFLLEPNPAVWDKDFAEMKTAGVNMIRTGIWTGWRLMLDEKGDVREEVLRAFEAFILTAKKYDIAVIFTFFAFMPEMFGGKNAYLDPVSLAGQKKFMSAFAERVRNAKDVIWDLINEPSFANPKALWSCRPNGDEFERKAWEGWLLRRYKAKDKAELSEILQEKWRLTADENPFDLPKDSDFDSVNILSERRPLRAVAFRFFAQDVFENWTSEMRRALKTAGNSAQFVTVGQDEAGNGDSPSQQFHSEAVDFTSLHNWWANDDLLWDNIAAKSPEKPSLIQETGVMSYEKFDGAMWRSEDETARLLERKMALAVGGNACGFVEWIWNTNPYMNIDNEAGIGFLRADGSEKPELKAFKRIAKFANENRPLFSQKQDEPTVLIIPHSYQFSPRNLATEALKKAVRTYHYHCRRTLRAVSEYNLEAILREERPPALLLLPSPRVLSEKAWKQILELVERGSTLAITGYFADDENYLPMERLADLGSKSIYPPVAVSQFEEFEIEGKSYKARFAGEKLQRVEKAYFPQKYLLEFQNGKVIWCPLPLELGETLEPLAAFYNYAIKKANLNPFYNLEVNSPSLLVRPTVFEKAFLYTIINESGSSQYEMLTHLPTKTKHEITLDGGRTQLIFIDKKTGKILAKTD